MPQEWEKRRARRADQEQRVVSAERLYAYFVPQVARWMFLTRPLACAVLVGSMPQNVAWPLVRHARLTWQLLVWARTLFKIAFAPKVFSWVPSLNDASVALVGCLARRAH